MLFNLVFNSDASATRHEYANKKAAFKAAFPNTFSHLLLSVMNSIRFIFALQQRMTHQKFICLSRTLTALTYCPHYKRLPATHITAREYLRDIRLIIFFSCFYIASFIKVNSQCFNHAFMLGMNETHCK